MYSPFVKICSISGNRLSHRPIFANIPTKINELGTDSESIATFFTQNISAGNIEKFESKLHTLNDACLNFYFKPDINDKDVQSQFSAFYTKLKDIYDDCFVEAVDKTIEKRILLTRHG